MGSPEQQVQMFIKFHVLFNNDSTTQNQNTKTNIHEKKQPS